MSKRDEPATHADKRRRRLRIVLMTGITAAFALGVAGYAAWWLAQGRYYVSTEDAYVAGNRLMLTPQIAGTVIAIHADDTDRVGAGQPVVELEDSSERVALQSAEASLEQAVRHVRELYEEEDGARATIDLRRTELAQAKRDYDRDKHLLKIKGVTQQQYQHSEAKYHGAQAALKAAEKHLAALETQTNGASLRDTPQVRIAVAKIHQAYLNLEHTSIPAPAGGYVAQRTVQIGERVTPGSPMLAIVPLDQLWVEANFKETELEHMRIGQRVTLTADQYGGTIVYHGKIAGIAAGTGSAFELLPPQNATGNWIKIVRRVPVRIDLDPQELAQHPLRVGLSMQAQVDVHDTSGPVLAQAPPKKARYRTHIYADQSGAIDRLVDRIIAGKGPEQARNSGQAAPQPAAE
jgi:membrane fusion protein (multidrug efflux system)